MASKGSQRVKAVSSWLLVAGVFVGIPALLIWAVGSPFPSVLPDWATVSRDLAQRNIPGSFVINTIALAVWAAWAQMTWAIIWELVIAGPRVAKGIRSRSAPLVAGPFSALATRIVSAGLAVGVATSASQTALPQRIIVAPDVVEFATTQPVVADVDEVQVSNDRHWLVEPGESLWSISGEDQSVAAQILALNNGISSPLDVLPGLSLRVPTSLVVPEGRLVPPSLSQPTSRVIEDLKPETRPLDTVQAAVRVSSPSVGDGTSDKTDTAYWEKNPTAVVTGDTIWGLVEDRLEAADQPTTNQAVLTYVADVINENPEVQSDPDLIHPGQVVVLPSIGQPPPADERTDEADVEQVEIEKVHDQTNVVALPPVRTVTDEVEPSTGLYDWVTRSRIDLGLGAGGLLLGASALSLLRRRRQYRIAHRKRGTIPTDPDPQLDDIERLLQSENRQNEAAWIAAAIASLSARPVWENEHVPVPVLARFDSEYLQVTLAAPDEMGAPVPWESVDNGVRWRLARSTPLEAIPPARVGYTTPTFVTIAEGTLLNLEGAGVLRVEGGSDVVRMGILRSVVHELATSTSACQVDIRSTVAIPGTADYSLVRHQSAGQLRGELGAWLSEFSDLLSESGRSNTYAYRLASPDEPVAPVVLLIDSEDEADLRSVSQLAGKRTLPIGVIQMSSAEAIQPGRQSPLAEHQLKRIHAEVDELPMTLRIDADGMANLEPFGLRLTPQTLSVSTANDLGLLLKNAASTGASPLVGNLQLSASVTNLADRHKSSVAARSAPVGADQTPWSALVPASTFPVDSSLRPERLADTKTTVVEASDDQVPVAISSDSSSVPTAEAPATDHEFSRSGAEPDGEAKKLFTHTDSPATNEASPVRRADAREPALASHLRDGRPAFLGENHQEDSDPKSTVETPLASPMMALVLGRVTVTGFDDELTPQQLSLVTFLACVGEANKATIVDALWDGKPISRSRFPNLLAETRAKIGRDTLPEAKSGVYRLHGVSTDLGRFEELVALATKQQAEDAIGTLKSAVDLVRGVPLTTPNGRYWTWIGDHTHLAARVESLISDAALRLSDLSVSTANSEDAIWACERGLQACPLDENLVSSLAEIYVAAGKLNSARRLVDSWEDKINRLECGEPSDGPRNRLAG